ncbi:MAG: SGNH/GDSL hydrolase family protein [Candidatus Lokiarchaeota archaeon]|nr:SGNH/GDSL hydrolase family protein [Candidatus Lokiarchaeota archaeon]
MLNDIVKGWRKSKNKPIRIIALGSSNTDLHWHSFGHFNWVSWLDCALREWVGRHITMINQGINGETVKDVLIRIDRDVVSYSPDAVIITIGGYDAMRGIPVDEYQQDLIKLVKIIQDMGSIPILQTYYCPLYDEIDVESFKLFPEFVEVNRVLATRENIPIIDHYRYFSPFYDNDPANYKKIMLDGLHVNPIGNSIMGIISCRLFYLPDPKILDDNHREDVLKYIKMMRNYCELPSRRTRSGREIKDDEPISIKAF